MRYWNPWNYLFRDTIEIFLGAVVDHAHIIWPNYLDKSSNNNWNNNNVRFATFQYRPIFCRAKKAKEKSESKAWSDRIKIYFIEESQRPCVGGAHYQILLCRRELSSEKDF